MYLSADAAASRTDWLAVAISAAAFILALLAFYLGSVKRADIWLAVVPNRPSTVRVTSSSQLPDGRIWPSSVSLDIQLIAANSGARAGVLTDITLRRLEEHEAEPVLFIEYAPLPTRLLQEMEELDGGSVRKYGFEILLPYSISLSLDDRENLAKLETLLKDNDVLDVTLGYSYVRGRSLLPKRRSKALVMHRELEFRVDLKSLLDSTRHKA